MDVNQLREVLVARWPSSAAGSIATTGMLTAAGVTDSALTAGVMSGLIRRLYRGSYIQMPQWEAAKPWQRDDLLIIAHAMAARSSGVYSHSTAARIHGLRTWDCGPAIHLIHPFSVGKAGHAAGIFGHQQELDQRQIAIVMTGGVRVRVTTLNQTVLDCARFFDLQRAVVMGDHALRVGARHGDLQSMLAASPIIRGSAKAGAVLEALDGRSESAGESRTRVLLSGMNLPLPVLQFEIQTPAGLHRADFAGPRYMLILEFDGWGKYFDYGPTDVALAQERKREKALMELGWTCIRVHWDDLAHPAALESRIRRAFENSGAIRSSQRHA